MLEFIMEHKTEFAAIGATLMALGGIIVKLTPTKVDDKWWRTIFGEKKAE